MPVLQEQKPVTKKSELIGLSIYRYACLSEVDWKRIEFVRDLIDDVLAL